MEKLLKVLTELQKQNAFVQLSSSGEPRLENVLPVRKDIVFNTKLVWPKECKKIIPSAGTTGTQISYRFDHPERYQRVVSWLLKGLLSDLKASPDGLFIFNCYPLGIQLPGNLYGADVSTRCDIIDQLLLMMGDTFESVVFVAQPHFAKKLIDMKFLDRMPSKKVGFILGGSWYPDSFSTYLTQQIELANHTPLPVLSFLGTAETGIGIGFMGEAEVKLRHQNESPVSEMIFRLNTEEYFIEFINGELAVTILDETALPLLVRYMTGDRGYFLPDNCFALKGRSTNGLVEHIQSLFFKDAKLPGLFTGQFWVHNEHIHFQGQGSFSQRQLMESMYDSPLYKYLEAQNLVSVIHPYKTYPYVQPLEKKPKYYYDVQT